MVAHHRRKNKNVFHEIGKFFTNTVPSITHDIGKGLNNTSHEVGSFLGKVEKKAEGVVHDLHEDLKDVIRLPKDIISDIPQILTSAGQSVSTAGRGLGSGLKDAGMGALFASPAIIGAALLGGIFLLKN